METIQREIEIESRYWPYKKRRHNITYRLHIETIVGNTRFIFAEKLTRIANSDEPNKWVILWGHKKHDPTFNYSTIAPIKGSYQSTLKLFMKIPQLAKNVEFKHRNKPRTTHPLMRSWT